MAARPVKALFAMMSASSARAVDDYSAVLSWRAAPRRSVGYRPRQPMLSCASLSPRRRRDLQVRVDPGAARISSQSSVNARSKNASSAEGMVSRL